jgi:hypothetical protein
MIEKLIDSTKIQRVYELESKSFGEFVSYKPATYYLSSITFIPFPFSAQIVIFVQNSLYAFKSCSFRYGWSDCRYRAIA